MVAAARRRGAGAARLHPEPPDPPPLRLVLRGDLHRPPHLGRHPCLPLPRRHPHGRGHRHHVDQRALPRRLHLLLPFLPAPVRRLHRCLLEGARPLWALALHHAPERASPALRVALALQRGPDRRLYPAALHGRHPRREDLLMATNESYETYEYDVLVIGAGGAGLRAAIEASAAGVKTALICKSLLGKAHTVMAEGGIAAAMGNVWKEDNWQVHFRDTMRGGKMLNNWRMAQLHAMESPDRVLELEEWGALFDRTKDGLISQRDFRGHRYARLAHIGDRTGLEMIRTLQQRAVHKGIDVHMECNVQRLLKYGDRVCGAVV